MSLTDPMLESVSTNALHLMPEGKVVMRVERDHIWIDPEIEVDEAARKVLSCLQQHMGSLFDAERRRCAEKVEKMGALGYGTLAIACAIRTDAPVEDLPDLTQESSPAGNRKRINRPWNDPGY